MREILFRGKRVDNGEWVYGFWWYIEEHNERDKSKEPFIKSKNNGLDYNIKKDTIGQYTGIKDKNGTKIFEGDVVIFNRGRNLPKYNSVFEVVKFNQGDCAFQRFPYGKALTIAGAGKLLQPDMMPECEVIANIYENPELLTHQQNKGE